MALSLFGALCELVCEPHKLHNGPERLLIRLLVTVDECGDVFPPFGRGDVRQILVGLTLGDLLDFEGNLRANATGELLALEHIDLWDGAIKREFMQLPRMPNYRVLEARAVNANGTSTRYKWLQPCFHAV